MIRPESAIQHINTTMELQDRVVRLEGIVEGLYKMIHHQALKIKGRPPNIDVLIGEKPKT